MSTTTEQVPQSWGSLTFEQAIEPITDEGKRIDKSDYLLGGKLPVIDQGEEFIGGYTNDTGQRYNGPLPVIVFGDHTRRVKLVDFPFVVGAQGVKLLKPKECWEPRFLAHLLPTLPLPDRGYGRHYQYLRQLKFSCPPRLLQQRIVAEIEKQFTRLEAGVAGLRRVQANLKRYRAAVLKAACEGKLVPTEACLRQAERGRQAELARQEDRTLPAPRPGVFFVYAIRCDNDSIYIGQTQDLQNRWQEHVTGHAANWTSQHKPLLIVHYEQYSSREEAVAREKWLKTGFGRKWLRREIAAGRLPAEQVGARQAGYETGAQFLERILIDRRQKWNGKRKYKEPARPDTTSLQELSEGWAWGSLDQICTKITDGEHLSPKTVSDGVFLLSAKDVREHGVQLNDPKFVSSKDAEEFRKRCDPELGDVLVVSRGATIGRIAVVQTSETFCLMGSVILLKSDQNTLGKYLAVCLRDRRAKDSLGIISGSTAQQAIYIRDIRTFAVSLPPFAEQQRIVAEVERRLSVVEELAAVVNANLQRAARLRQSILQKAFTGTLV